MNTFLGRNRKEGKEKSFLKSKRYIKELHKGEHLNSNSRRREKLKFKKVE